MIFFIVLYKIAVFVKQCLCARLCERLCVFFREMTDQLDLKEI